MSVVNFPTIEETRILELRRDDNDRPEWVEVDIVRQRGEARVVLVDWLYAEDVERYAGTYRAERGDDHAEAVWTGEELAA